QTHSQIPPTRAQSNSDSAEALMSAGFRVFLSAVTSECGEARKLVASDLCSRGLEVKVQEDFRQEEGADTTLKKLHEYVKGCDAVVAMMGKRSGSFPPDAAAEPFKDVLPDGIERASMTQWEVLFARKYGTRMSIYVASDKFVAADEGNEDDDRGKTARQRRQVEALGAVWHGRGRQDAAGDRVWACAQDRLFRAAVPP